MDAPPLTPDSLVQAERERLLAELHDGPLQTLYAAESLAHLVARHLDDPDLAPHAKRLVEVVGLAIHSMAEAVHGLDAAEVRAHGLAEALRRLCDHPTGFVGFSALGSPPDPPVERAHHVYRIAQCALANALRHGRRPDGPLTVEVRLEVQHGRLWLVVDDDGPGFSVGADGAGFGLRHMHQRAQTLGGDLHVQMRPAGGTRVWLDVPHGVP